MRKPIIGGNWKMYKNINEGEILSKELVEKLNNLTEVDVSTIDSQEEFAIKAIAYREPHMFINPDGTINVKKVTASTNPIEIIKPIRGEDRADNLWATFNVVQERMVKGGYNRVNEAGRKGTTRGITNATRNVDYNKQLWAISETYMS